MASSASRWAGLGTAGPNGFPGEDHLPIEVAHRPERETVPTPNELFHGGIALARPAMAREAICYTLHLAHRRHDALVCFSVDASRRFPSASSDRHRFHASGARR